MTPPLSVTAPLSESEYDSLAHPELEQLIASLDAIASDDIEAELASDILTIEFSDGTRYVLNSHRAARRIWLSAERSAWHFDFSATRKAWIAGKTGDELWATLARLVSEKLAQTITLHRA